jgi:hypothetical protein
LTSTTTPTLSAVLGKLKVGGLVLLATVVVAGTAEAATGSNLFSDGSGDPVAAEVGDCPTEEPVTDPSTDPSDASDGTTDCGGTQEPVSEPVDDPADDPAGDPADDPAGDPADDPVEEADDVQPASDGPIACEDARTHGEYVSSVAHSTPPGPGHGAAVSEAARSDCGKPGADAGDAADDSSGQPAGGQSSDDQGDDTSGSHGGSGDGWVPPGQAKKDATANGAPSSPGNSANAPGHDH